MSTTARVAAAVVLAVGGSLAFKYAPAQMATMAQPPAPLTSVVNRSGLPADSGFVRIARAVTPAVVYIENSSVSRAAARRQQLPEGFQLPPGFQMPQGNGRAIPRTSSGSGFIVSSTGEILTNNHVVEGADKLLVTLYDRRIFTAKVVGRDPATDVALIKIDATGLPTLPLGDDAAVQVGQPVLAIGAPLGLRSTVTSGIISAKERGGDLNQLFNSQLAIADFLQTDAVINPGNSGGPLIDMDGRVVGINSAIESPTGVYAGYGFAVPASIAKIAMDQFRQYGRVKRALLGVQIRDVEAVDAQAAGLKEIRGAMVQSVTEAGGAEKAGLKPGDLIVSIDEKPVSSVATLQRTIYGYKPGQTVTLGYARFGTNGTARVTLQQADEPKETVASADRGDSSNDATPASKLGVSVQPLTAQIASQAQLSSNVRGVIVSDVEPTGPAQGVLGRGDVITAVIGRGGVQRPIQTAAQLNEAAAAAGNGIVSLLVYTPQLKSTRVVNLSVAP